MKPTWLVGRSVGSLLLPKLYTVMQRFFAQVSTPARISLAAIDGTAVRQHIEVTGPACPVLHPVLQEGFVACTLGTKVLVLAARVLFTKLTRASCEHLKTEDAMVHLVGERQEAWVVHVGMLCRNVVLSVARVPDMLPASLWVTKEQQTLSEQLWRTVNL